MDRNRAILHEPGSSPPSEAWLFAQALLGKSAPSRTSEAAKAQIDREHLEWLAKISPEHEHRLRSEIAVAAQAAAERRQLVWLASISTEHEVELRRVLAAEAAASDARARYKRPADSRDLQEAQWDPAKHPRLGGAPNAGWFASTGGGRGGGGGGGWGGTVGSAGLADRAEADDHRRAKGEARVPPRMPRSQHWNTRPE